MQAEFGLKLWRDLQSWNPEEKPVHCSNCLFAKVFGVNEEREPIAKCKRGYGLVKSRRLSAMIRRDKRAFGFKDARKCIGFQSMSTKGEE